MLGTKIVHIGTRALAVSPEKNIFSLAKPASSVSELVYDLIQELGVKIDPDIATNLIMGIEEGSRDFKGPDVTAKTFESIASLLKSGGKRLPEKFQRNNPPPTVLPENPQANPEAVEEEAPKDPPSDWLEPKIYKGTSIS